MSLSSGEVKAGEVRTFGYSPVSSHTIRKTSRHYTPASSSSKYIQSAHHYKFTLPQLKRLIWLITVQQHFQHNKAKLEAVVVASALDYIIIIIIQHLYSAIMSYADTEALVAPVKSE